MGLVRIMLSPQSWSRILSLGSLCRTTIGQRRKRIQEHLVQSSGFAMKKKLKIERADGWFQALQWLGVRFWGEKADIEKRTQRNWANGQEPFARITEVQDFRASRNDHGKFCTRVSLRQVTDMSPVFLGFYSQFCNPDICYMSFGKSSHSLAFIFPISTMKIIILALSASWDYCKTFGKNDTLLYLKNSLAHFVLMAFSQLMRVLPSFTSLASSPEMPGYLGLNWLMTSRCQ